MQPHPSSLRFGQTAQDSETRMRWLLSTLTSANWKQNEGFWPPRWFTLALHEIS
jgi:hypothetical protein